MPAWLRRRGVIPALAALGVVLLTATAFAIGRLPAPDDPGGMPAALDVTDAPTPGPTASGTPDAGTSGLGVAPTPSAKPTPRRASPSASPSRQGPAAQPRSTSGWPGESNTGVPDGTRLTKYSGPCTITANNAVIDGKQVDCDLSIQAKGVVIRKSKVNGRIDSTEESPYSFTLEDSTVDAGERQQAAVGTTNMTIRRADISGGVTSVYCWANCDIRDSWLHGQRLPENVDWHLGGFLANDDGSQGSTNATLIHNTIICDAKPNSVDGGCSGNVNMFGDFGPISHVTVQNNLLGANDGISYCVYGGSSGGKPFSGGAQHVVVVDNVFQRGSNGKCGGHGPVTAFDPSRPGNRWSGNVWEGGGAVESAS
jgi:hypothetical protein